MNDKATSQRDVDQARNDHAVAESDFATAQGAVQAARNSLRVIVGRDGQEIERVEHERIINPLITINAPIDGTMVNREDRPGPVSSAPTRPNRSTRSPICRRCG